MKNLHLNDTYLIAGGLAPPTSMDFEMIAFIEQNGKSDLIEKLTAAGRLDLVAYHLDRLQKWAEDDIFFTNHQGWCGGHFRYIYS